MSFISIVLSQKSFLKNSFTLPTHKLKLRALTVTYGKTMCGNYSQDDEQQSQRKNENMLGKLAMFGLDDASTRRTGGRVGGQFFRSPATPSGPKSKNSRRTKNNVESPKQHQLVGGYGCGIGVPIFGSWGSTPFSFFGSGPTVAECIGETGIKSILLFILIGLAAAVISKHFMSRDEDDTEIE